MRLDLLACRVVGANQQVADDLALRIAQRGHRNNRRKTAAVLADVGQLVDVFYPARGLEHQRLEAGGDRRVQLHAECGSAGDHLLGVGDVSGRDLVHHFRCGVAKHLFRADVEDLYHAFCIGRYAGKIRAVENRVLQRAGLEQFLFGQLARGVVRADQQV
ncbi:MAG: hypothetical protein ABIP16_02640, partial [Thermomonas sp.]